MMNIARSSIPVLLTFDLDGEISTRMALKVNEPGITDPESERIPGFSINFLSGLAILVNFR